MNNYKKGKIKKCNACNKEYYVPFYRILNSRFCSRNCQNSKQYNHIEKNCLNCNNIFIVSPSRVKTKKYCSNCNRISKHNEKNARKERNKKLRIKRGTYSQGFLRKITLERLQNKCFICGFNEYKECLDVHHIDNNPNNNDEKNVTLLCVMCHRKLHRKLITIKSQARK